LLQQAYEQNLVQFGEMCANALTLLQLLRCCCEALIAARKFGMLNPSTLQFFAGVDETQCNAAENASASARWKR